MSDFETETPRFVKEGFTSPTHELHLDPLQVIVLSGRTVEYLRADRPADESNRFHVRHIAVEMKPARRGGYKLKMGLRRDGGVWNLAEADVSEEKLNDVTRFFEVVKAEAAR